jgi:hypothetical protein
MSDFSITTLFVATTGTLGTGTSETLTGGQIGVYNPDNSVASSGTIAAQPYIYIAEGRIESIPGTGTKKSGKIAAKNVLEWYKVTANSNVPVQITTFSNFSLLCQQDITFTFVAHSFYLDTLYYNGLTQSVTLTTACCDCGDAPCAEISAADIQAFVDQAVAKLQAHPILSVYLTFQRQSSGANSTLVVSEKPLTKYGQPCDIAAFPYLWDRLSFRAFAIANAPTTQDFQVLNACSQVATVTINQRSLYDMGSSDQIKQLEKNYYSTQAGAFKALYRMGGFNEAFTSYVTDGTYYDTYYIKFSNYHQGNSFTDTVGQTQTAILAFATTTGSAFETLLEVYLGDAADKSSTNPTTTTTTSTTSTSTTSTTTLFP